MEKKVLIITYYWPPSGGSGVQRWLKFVKYLPQFGWQPYVYTPEIPAFDIKDDTLLSDIPPEAEVIKLPIWEPYFLVDAITGLFGSKKLSTAPADERKVFKSSLLQLLIAWIRANFFIPDPRIFWIRPSVKFLHDFLREREISTVITTGPPHSMHLIGLKLKQKNPSLHWIADFRDPWTEWGLWEKLGVGQWAMRRHQKLEHRVLTTADEVISVTPFYVQRFEALSGRSVHLLTNGFDDDDVKQLQYVRPSKFTIRHIGIVNEQRDPIPFMEALEQWLRENEAVQDTVALEFIGDVYPPFLAYVQKSPFLQRFVTCTGNVSHKMVMQYYGSTSLLLLVLTGYRDPHGFFPGKLFEYIATGIPVLGIGPPESEAADVLQETGTGIMVEGDDVSGIIQVLQREYERWKLNTGSITRPVTIERYSRKVITGKLVGLLK
jgi:glycosyltransferase involved in cell wall biosynthesis